MDPSPFSGCVTFSFWLTGIRHHLLSDSEGKGVWEGELIQYNKNEENFLRKCSSTPPKKVMRLAGILFAFRGKRTLLFLSRESDAKRPLLSLQLSFYSIIWKSNPCPEGFPPFRSNLGIVPILIPCLTKRVTFCFLCISTNHRHAFARFYSKDFLSRLVTLTLLDFVAI